MAGATKRTPWERVRDGSLSHSILLTVDRLTTELRRGVEISEIREAYPDQHGDDPPDTLTSIVHSMKSRGVLAVVGGRSGHTLFALADAELEGSERSDDEVLLVLAAVQACWARVGRAVSTRDVLREFRDRHPEVQLDTPNTVRKHLETLAKARIRGPRGFRDPQVVRIAADGDSDVAAAYWIPVEANEEFEEVETEPRSTAEAVRRAVAAVEAQLWRHVSATEVRWWADVPKHSAHIGGKLRRDRIRQALSDTARADDRAGMAVGRLTEVRTWYTCHGGAPPRYSTQGTDEISERVSVLMDMAVALRPHEEILGIARLLNRNHRLRRPILSEIGLDRGDLILGLLEEARGPIEHDQVEHWLLRGERVKRDWLYAAELTTGQREGRLQVSRTELGNLRSVVDILRWQFVHGPRQWLATPGLAALADLEELQPLLDLAGETLGIRSRRGRQGIIEKARRFPFREAPQGDRFVAPVDTPLSAVDRVDALVAIWELFPVPAAQVLLNGAHDVLGHVLRDEARLLEYLARTPESDTWTRHSLAVALGALGHPPSADLVVREPGNYDDAVAWIFATVLADWTSGADRIRAGGGPFTGGAGRVAETAVRRLDAGHVFSVIG